MTEVQSAQVIDLLRQINNTLLGIGIAIGAIAGLLIRNSFH